jgi:glycosyltransferase involved in cell wall biosynthesis
MLSILFSIWLVASAILVSFYLFVFGKLVKVKSIGKNVSQPPVSVVVCSKNNYNGLQKIIPLLLNQKYKEFEIVIVNDHSTDETEKFLNQIQSPKLRVVHFTNDKKFEGKKEALSLGIEKAKYDWVLLTDSDCIPQSDYWILSMMNAQNNQNNDVVLGIGYYEQKNSLLNKIIQYDTLLIAIQYLSFAKINQAYMGVGRNIAYKKSVFTTVNGFKKHEHITSGDDDLFIQTLPQSTNIGIQLDLAGSTISEAKNTFKDWLNQKSRHLSTGFKYKTSHLFLLGLFQLSIILFYLTPLFLITSNHLINYTIAIIVLKYFIQIQIFHKISLKVKYNRFNLFFLPFEFLWVLLGFVQMMYKLTLRKKTW